MIALGAGAAAAAFAGLAPRRAGAVLRLDVTQGSVDPTFNFSLFNFGTNPTFTAGLDFDGVTPSGDSSVLTTDLAGSAGSLSLAGGLSHAFAAILDTATACMFSATYTLMLSDENIAGALNKSLTLTLMGNVTAPGGLAGELRNDPAIISAYLGVGNDIGGAAKGVAAAATGAWLAGGSGGPTSILTPSLASAAGAGSQAASPIAAQDTGRGDFRSRPDRALSLRRT